MDSVESQLPPDRLDFHPYGWAAGPCQLPEMSNCYGPWNVLAPGMVVISMTPPEKEAADICPRRDPV
jgi:hypothetical protein